MTLQRAGAEDAIDARRDRRLLKLDVEDLGGKPLAAVGYAP
jgi:hypothetical protein